MSTTKTTKTMTTTTTPLGHYVDTKWAMREMLTKLAVACSEFHRAGDLEAHAAMQRHVDAMRAAYETFIWRDWDTER